MDEKVVTLNGQPLPPELPYDPGLLDILERVIAELKHGNVTGVAVVWISGRDQSFDVDVNYQGPRLSLMAGAARLQHRLNLALDPDIQHPT